MHLIFHFGMTNNQIIRVILSGNLSRVKEARHVQTARADFNTWLTRLPNSGSCHQNGCICLHFNQWHILVAFSSRATRTIGGGSIKFTPFKGCQVYVIAISSIKSGTYLHSRFRQVAQSVMETSLAHTPRFAAVLSNVKIKPLDMHPR